MPNPQSIVGSSEGRSSKDFYPTPIIATKALLEREEFDGLIWEPACGDGAISEVLKQFGHEVVSSDLFDYGYSPSQQPVDFNLATPFSVHGIETFPNIITNPPYGMAQPFIERALSFSTGKVAMLLKTVFLEGQRRKPLFDRKQLKTVYVFRYRLQFGRNGESYANGGMISFSWFVWDKSYSGDPSIKWIEK